MVERASSASPALELMSRFSNKTDYPVDKGRLRLDMGDINMLVASLPEEKGGGALRAALTEVVVTFFRTGKIPASVSVEER